MDFHFFLKFRGIRIIHAFCVPFFTCLIHAYPLLVPQWQKQWMTGFGQALVSLKSINRRLPAQSPSAVVIGYLLRAKRNYLIDWNHPTGYLFCNFWLTHWIRWCTYASVNWVMIGSVQRKWQAITWTNNDLLFIGPFKNNMWNWNSNTNIFCHKMHLKFRLHTCSNLRSALIR